MLALECQWLLHIWLSLLPFYFYYYICSSAYVALFAGRERITVIIWVVQGHMVQWKDGFWYLGNRLGVEQDGCSAPSSQCLHSSNATLTSNSFRLLTSSFLSAGDSLRDRKAKGWSLLSCSERCERTAPTPFLEVSTSTTNCQLGSRTVRMGAWHKGDSPAGAGEPGEHGAHESHSQRRKLGYHPDTHLQND